MNDSPNLFKYVNMAKARQTNEERRSIAVNAIIDSAREHFANCGFAGASISVISKKAGVNPSLIYHYFENKEELWKAVKRQSIAANVEHDFLREDDNEDLLTFIDRVVTKRFEFYRANPELLKIINWEQLQENDARLYGIQSDYKWPWKRELLRFVRNGEARSDLDPELAASFMISSLRSIFTDIPNLYGPKESEKKQKAYLNLVIDSVHRAFRAAK